MTTNITPITQEYVVDMSSNNNFIQVPAVQGDGNYTRYVQITLVENGQIYEIPPNVGVYIAGTKPDNKTIFNNCEIIDTNKIKFEVTYQMTTVEGRGEYQIVFIDSQINSQIKSFPFYIITTRSFDAEEMVSSNEYQALAELVAKMQEDYSVYVEQCQEAADAAHTSEENAALSEINAATSETNAHTSEENAKTSELNAKASETEAKVSETNAKASELNASASETNAANSESNAEAWAVGQRNGADVPTSDVTYQNNAKYWAERAADWSQHDASHLTYTLEDGTQVNLASFLKIIEDLDGETLLLL